MIELQASAYDILNDLVDQDHYMCNLAIYLSLPHPVGPMSHSLFVWLLNMWIQVLRSTPPLGVLSTLHSGNSDLKYYLVETIRLKK